MVRITVFFRSSKRDGDVNVRIRVRDTARKIDIFHKTDIKASLHDLERLTPEGNKRPGIKLFNKGLSERIKREIDLCEKAYGNLMEGNALLTGQGAGLTFERGIGELTAGGPPNGGDTFLGDFNAFIDDKARSGEISPGRERHYRVLSKELGRWLTVRGRGDMTSAQFGAASVMDFRDFLVKEYKYVKRWGNLYDGVRNVPTKERGANTVACKLKMLHSFFNAAVETGDLDSDPFKRMRKGAKHAIMRESYNKAVCLTLEELSLIKGVQLPDSLKEARDCFLLHCTTGQRVGDFSRMGMANVAVDPSGIPYIHYLAEKTKGLKNDNGEIETPVLYDSLALIKKYKFNFSCLSYAYGKSGYNKKIRDILKLAGIDRPCAVMNPKTGQNDYKPLYELASSKLCRKTYVNLLAECQVNQYIGGLHKVGSSAVLHYLNPTLRDRFIIASAAFGQRLYKTDKELNVIEED